MASRVLLFADFGKGPKMVSAHGAPKPNTSAAYKRDTARRWWLVECESADAGRRVIAAWQNSGGRDGDWSQSLGGRILDSDGAS